MLVTNVADLSYKFFPFSADRLYCLFESMESNHGSTKTRPQTILLQHKIQVSPINPSLKPTRPCSAQIGRGAATLSRSVLLDCLEMRPFVALFGKIKKTCTMLNFVFI